MERQQPTGSQPAVRGERDEERQVDRTSATRERLPDDWRLLGSGAEAWFAADSATAAAALVRLLAERAVPVTGISLRAEGIRVHLDRADVEAAAAVSEAAHDAGLAADPSVLQRLDLVLGSADPEPLGPFWEAALGHRRDGDVLSDPAGRDPRLTLERWDVAQELRNRIHLDSVRSAEAVERAAAAIGGQGGGPYGVRRSDADGNEVDLLAGDPLTETPDTDDWRVVFAAMVHYPVPSPTLAAALVGTVAEITERSGVPLLVDVGPTGVTIDSGKDRFSSADGSVPKRCADVAAQVQSAARELGLRANTDGLRFVQVGIDAADIQALRTFWTAVLGYELDPRQDVTDIVDPHRLSPVLFFQHLDDDPERRSQRNRFRLSHRARGPREGPADCGRGRRRHGPGGGSRTAPDQRPRGQRTGPDRHALSEKSCAGVFWGRGTP